jgi:hypothetical protein
MSVRDCTWLLQLLTPAAATLTTRSAFDTCAAQARNNLTLVPLRVDVLSPGVVELDVDEGDDGTLCVG